MPFLTRRDSDGREKAEAYGVKEARRKSGKKKNVLLAGVFNGHLKS